MKKIFILIPVLLFNLHSFSQDSIRQMKVYHNELGIDVTGFIKNILPFSQGQFSSNYDPTYYITYRRHFKFGNIRSAIGGSYLGSEINPELEDDLNSYHNVRFTIDFRAGWEFISEISKRWQIYYGLDFRPTISYSKNDATNFHDGYANGRESNHQILGFAPLLGFRFRLNNRLSLTTETSVALNFEKSKERRYFTPTTNQYPPLPDVNEPVERKIYTSFSQPFSIIFTVAL